MESSFLNYLYGEISNIQNKLKIVEKGDIYHFYYLNPNQNPHGYILYHVKDGVSTGDDYLEIGIMKQGQLYVIFSYIDNKLFQVIGERIYKIRSFREVVEYYLKLYSWLFC